MVGGEHLENVKYEKADASDQVEQTEEMLLKEIKSQIDGIQIDSIDKMTKDQLATFIEKEFQTTDGKRLTYSKMKAKGDFYAFSLEAAMDFISDTLGDRKFTSEGVEDTDGTKEGKTLDDRLKEYGGVDAIDDDKNANIVILLQKIMGVTADGYAGPETMANITALLKGSALASIQVEGYDENNPYAYTTISKLLPATNDEKAETEVQKNTIQDKITAYTADGVTEEVKTKLVTELEADLVKSITNYTGVGFHKNLATAILTQQTSFSWNNITFYPIITADGTITITDKSDEAETKRNEVEKTKKESERLAKATAYSEKLFPSTLSIAQAGDVWYITIPETKTSWLAVTTPEIVAKIPFSSKENAQKFIAMSKIFIQSAGYNIDPTTNISKRLYLSAKTEYLNKIEKLIAVDEDGMFISGMLEKTKIRASLSTAIDALDCWTKESVA